MDDPRASVHVLGRRTLGPPRPVKAHGPHVSRGMRPEDALRATLSDCLAQITANAATLRVGRSVEGLHQLRIGFRRLEAALGAFGREFEQTWLEELRGRAKILSGRLAPARDLDVFVGKLLAEPPQGEGFQLLRARAEEARDAAWEAATAWATSTEFEAFAGDMAALASTQLPLTRQRHLPKTAGRMLDRQVARVKKRGRTARSREEGDLHRLRIALKKLRYTAEFFAPLYPQYCGATTATAFDALADALKALRWQPAIRTLPPYYDEPAHIAALEYDLSRQLAALPFAPEVLLLSFHGMPERTRQLGDPYHDQCRKTARLVEAALKADWPDLRIETSFQSRFGRAKWLEPATDAVLAEEARRGTKRLAIAAPGFSADCLETREELAIRGREQFLEAGGEHFAALDCLNDSEAGMTMLEALVRRELAGWI